MSRLAFAFLLALQVGCGGPSGPHAPLVPPKAPNVELIVGEYERRPPVGTTAIRFDKDGTVHLAHDKTKFDGPVDGNGKGALAAGTWKMDGDQLTINYTEGVCAQDGPGIYKVVLSKLGVHFAKVDDSCEQRAKIDNEVWHRVQ